MDLRTNAFRTITEKAGFDINAGQNIDATKTLKEMIEYVERYIDENHKGCCFHASVYLMKLLHEAGIESEIILTAEPTVLENGETRTDMRASVMVNDGDRYIVMNPIEDIEFFEKNQIPTTSRKDFYEETVLQGEKSGIQQDRFQTGQQVHQRNRQENRQTPEALCHGENARQFPRSDELRPYL